MYWREEQVLEKGRAQQLQPFLLNSSNSFMDGLSTFFFLIHWSESFF